MSQKPHMEGTLAHGDLGDKENFLISKRVQSTAWSTGFRPEAVVSLSNLNFPKLGVFLSCFGVQATFQVPSFAVTLRHSAERDSVVPTKASQLHTMFLSSDYKL